MMSREDRAKQFAPFEALTGLRKALRQKEIEHERTEKIELSEARAAKLDRMLKKLERGTFVRVTYYNAGYYIDVEGEVSSVDKVCGCIKIGNGKIFFDDLYDIKLVGTDGASAG
ncbi:MAG: YolD-like family protein [Clostridiales bacterium]|nr:YolD-like family protein [Clostridiales bacterium]